MKYVGNHTRAQAPEEMYERTKSANLKKVKAQVDAQQKKLAESSKIMNANIKTPDKKPNARDFLADDVSRVHHHKELMMDWLFTEMEEHSKKLQMYADFFDYFERGLNVEQEFALIMDFAKNIEGAGDGKDFILQKRQEKEAAARG